MGFPGNRPSLPVLPIFFDAQPNVLVASCQVVFGEQAEGQPLLLRFHLAEQAGLKLGQPVVQGVELVLSSPAGVEKNLLALLHVIRKRLLVTPGVGLKLLDQVADHPGAFRHSLFSSKLGAAFSPASQVQAARPIRYYQRPAAPPSTTRFDGNAGFAGLGMVRRNPAKLPERKPRP